MSDELKVAIEAAKAGARAALKYFNTNPSFVLKPDGTPVTKADKESEEAIRQTILKAFANARFLGEEGGGNLTKNELWVIDPLDGTKNFIRGLPFWGIEIAFVRDKKIILGVSFGPCIDELLYAEKAGGAFCNGTRTFVSKIPNLPDAFLNHGTTLYFEEKTQNLLALLNKVNRERGYGDFYGYHLVATGRADIMLDARNGPWDIAALKVVIEEAGGRVTNFEGKPWSLSDSTAVATDSLLHDKVINILNEKN